MENITVGVVGLGRMGFAIAQRLHRAGLTVVGLEQNDEKKSAVLGAGMKFTTSYDELAKCASVVWLMVPAGEAVDAVLAQLQGRLAPGSVVIDGGNSFFKDSVRRHQALAAAGLHFVDCGTSGGVHGGELGYSLMVGGDAAAVESCRPLFDAIAMQPDGFVHVGPSGAGHFVKMVHNGIEYALLQGYAEGFHLLKDGPYRALDLAAVAKVWNNGSIIRSWICQLAQDVLTKDQELADIAGGIGENKTGQWTTQVAREHQVPLQVIEASLAVRAWSRATGGNYATKLVAMLRNAFGGHPVDKIGK